MAVRSLLTNLLDSPFSIDIPLETPGKSLRVLLEPLEVERDISDLATRDELEDNTHLIALQSAGKILLSFEDSGSGLPVAEGGLAFVTQANRPTAAAFGVGSVFNTTTNQPNWSNGTSWYDANGNLV